ncbi:MAG: DEAD/DEAH box helicase [Litoreibacter sp.]
MIKTLADALEARGYETLTPVQQAVTSEEYAERDLLVSAQTGSGKTVGFGLAVAPTLLNEDGKFGRADKPLALMIAPTRELAMQVKRELEWLYAEAGAVIASAVGGMDMRSERRAMDRGAHIVVATPGRVLDHIKRGVVDMSDIRAIVLDEADEMLDLGFREDLEFILGSAPEDRRTLLFSATVPAQIAKLSKKYMKPDAARVETKSEQKQHSDIEYRALTCAPFDVENAIINVLRFYEAKNALVFCNTRAAVNRLTARFSNRGFQVVSLSGELSQSERTHALQAMRDGRARVCVATDVAARGIDLPGLELVVHADLPTNGETLLHRSGRTGRAGRKGVSALIVPVRQRSKAERLLRFAKVTATWAEPPSADEVNARDQERLMADPVWQEPVNEDETAFVEKLTAAYTAEQIAAAYMRLYRDRSSAPEDLAAAPSGKNSAKSPKAAFGPSEWFSVNVGRDQRAEPRWLLPMICKAGGITKDDIGAIRIQPNETFVELKKDSVDGFLKVIGPDMALEEGAKLTKVDGTPDIKPMERFPKDRGDRGPRKPRDDRAPRKSYDKKPAPRSHHSSDDWPDRKPPRDAEVTEKLAKPARKVHEKEVVAPYKSDKPKGKPKPKFEGKPGKKPHGKPGDKPRGKPEHKSGDKPRGKSEGRPAKPKANAADPSKRFTPPGGKPRVSRGANAKPRRSNKT